MTWGPYWLFYQCPACGKKFRHTLDDTPDEVFAMCPSCKIKSDLKADSGNYPSNADEYEII